MIMSEVKEEGKQQTGSVLQCCIKFRHGAFASVEGGRMVCTYVRMYINAVH